MNQVFTVLFDHLIFKMEAMRDYRKIFFQHILPKYALTIFAGILAQVRITWIKDNLIRYFIRKYKVNMAEAQEENVKNYACFNDFFIRRLKPSHRPIANADIISPVDGYISEIGKIEIGQMLQAKGRLYAVQELLACEPQLSMQFEHGVFATMYLSPQDYHRVHMPITATLQEMRYVPGKLFSVQPATTRKIPRLFAKNERLVVVFDTAVGLMAMVMVGAALVGKIGASWHGDICRKQKNTHFIYSQSTDINTLFNKADEMGYFKLGSTVILLFAERARVQWMDHIRSGDKINFGAPLGIIH